MTETETADQRRTRYRAEIASDFGLTDEQAAQLEGETKKELQESAVQLLSDTDEIDLDNSDVNDAPVLRDRTGSYVKAESGNLSTHVFRSKG